VREREKDSEKFFSRKVNNERERRKKKFKYDCYA
jgi:hypothetical protein